MTNVDRKSQRALLDLMVDAVCVCRDDVIMGANATGRRLLAGAANDDVIGKSLAQFLGPDFVGLDTLAATRTPARMVLRCLDGEQITTEILASASTQEPGAVIVVIRDVTERTRAAAENRMKSVLDAFPDAVFLSNASDVIQLVNLVANRLFRRNDAELVGLRLSELLPAHADLPPDTWLPTLALRTDGTTFYAEIAMGRVLFGEETQTIHVVRDVTDRQPQPEPQPERVRYQANYDSLTGLPNRSLLMDRLGQALTSASRIGVMRISLGDVLGHFGESVLMAVADRLAQQMQPHDTLARFSDDEFVVLMPLLDQPRVATVVADRILKAFAEPLPGSGTVVALAIGIAIYPDDGPDDGALLEVANTAMGEASREKTTAFRFGSTDLNREAADQIRIWSELDLALVDDEFYLHYQPRVDIRTGRITAVEALLRWTNRTLGEVAPARFIPAIEEAGRMGAIGDRSLELACRQLAQWNREDINNVRMAVNLSDWQLRHPDFIATLRKILARTGADPRLLDIEITEEMLNRNAEAYITALWNLRELGVRLVMDDFGSGSSSLTNLQRFPIDAIKIDRFFVSESGHGDDGEDLVKAIIAMGHCLGRQVIAMGVETEAQFNVLWRCGCNEAQGNLISAAVDALKITKMLKAGLWPLPQRQ